MAIMQSMRHDSARIVYNLCQNGDKSLVFVSIIGFLGTSDMTMSSENIFLDDRDD